MTFATAIASIFAMNLVQMATFIGLGLLLMRFSRTENRESHELLLYFWPGLTLAFGTLQLWHCFLPVDWRISALLGAGGLYGLVAHRSHVRRSLTNGWNTYGWAGVCLLGIFLIWIAQLMLHPANDIDNGNYHLPSIRWASTYPIVKGLGNIDGHYAFNSTTFLHHAALEFGFWRGRSAHVASGPLLIVLFLQLFGVVHRLLSNREFSYQAGLAPALLLTPLTYCLLSGNFRPSNPGTDMPVTVLMFVLALLLWGLSRATISGDSEERERIPSLVFALACAAAAAATVKASSWVFVLLSLTIGLTLLLGAKELPWRLRRNGALASIAVFGIVLGTWGWRSILLSGYPLFPSTFLPFPVPWKIPIEYASWSGWFISAFARGAFGVPENTGEQVLLAPIWVAPYWRVMKIEAMLPLSLAIASAAAYFLAPAALRASFRKILASNRLTVLPVAISLLIWYAATPSMRFGAALLWIASAVPAGAALGLAREERQRRAMIVAACTLPVLAVGLQIVTVAKGPQLSIVQAIQSTLFVSCGPDYCFHPPPSSQLEPVKTRFAVTAYTPVARSCEDREYTKCVIWNAPLPAGQQIRPTLAFLDPARPMEGFITNEPAGEWLRIFGEEVRMAHKTEGLAVRELAMRFRVHPRYIRQALQPGP